MSDFDFTDAVRQLQSRGLIGPDEISEKLLAEMTTQQLLEIAAPLVRERVRHALRALRTDPVRPMPVQEKSSNVVPMPAVGKGSGKRGAGAKNSARTWRKFSPAERLERALSGQFSYGGVNWGVTGDLILDQVQTIASEYHRDGQTLIEKGVNWDALAEKMASHKVARVRDLPKQVLIGFFVSEEAA